MTTKPRKPRALKRSAPAKTAVDERRERIDANIVRISHLRNQKDQLDDEIKTVQMEILDDMNGIGEQSIVYVTPEGHRMKATVVAPSRTTLDEGALKNRLGAVLWNKITSRVLDRKKLEACMGNGIVDPLVVADCSTTTSTAPYIKVTD